MVETRNHGVASEALLVYKTAFRGFIAQQLKAHSGGAGDWIESYVIPCLGEREQEAIRRHIRDQKEQRESLHRPIDGEGPEQFLEEGHFPPIVKEHWKDVFRHPLKHRDTVLNDLRRMKKSRNDVAHARVPLEDEDLVELLDTCRRLLEAANQDAAQKIQMLMDWGASPHSDDVDAEAVEQLHEASGAVDDNAGTEGEPATPSTGEPVSEPTRLDQLAAEYLRADEAAEALLGLQSSIEEAMSQIGLEFYGNIEDELTSAWAQVRGLQFEDIGPELIAETMRAPGGWDESGNMIGIDAEGSQYRVRVNVAIDIRDVDEYDGKGLRRLRPPWEQRSQ